MVEMTPFGAENFGDLSLLLFLDPLQDVTKEINLCPTLSTANHCSNSFVCYCFLQTKQYFREYMEDYNTATLPHEKYINLEKWEMAEFHRE